MEGQQERFVQGPQQSGTLYQRVGGIPYFNALVESFYAKVEADPALRPLYPEDLEPGKNHLAMFLVQIWGGPPYYAMERGRPLLRMRHLPFAIGQAERGRVVLAHERVRAGLRGGPGGCDDAD